MSVGEVYLFDLSKKFTLDQVKDYLMNRYNNYGHKKDFLE